MPHTPEITHPVAFCSETKMFLDRVCYFVWCTVIGLSSLSSRRSPWLHGEMHIVRMFLGHIPTPGKSRRGKSRVDTDKHPACNAQDANNSNPHLRKLWLAVDFEAVWLVVCGNVSVSAWRGDSASFGSLPCSALIRRANWVRSADGAMALRSLHSCNLSFHLVNFWCGRFGVLREDCFRLGARRPRLSRALLSACSLRCHVSPVLLPFCSFRR